jgi:hypothetical protein
MVPAQPLAIPHCIEPASRSDAQSDVQQDIDMKFQGNDVRLKVLLPSENRIVKQVTLQRSFWLV